ncbi:hypothetical protein QBZ16_002556 [Prototheca wickerhamii]|uniref:Peptidase M20 dimerisation domain-containing protein n=1 Tax=Prototheca wickerhamii TaxID=3111 RepID=A0AAD9IJH6_PROWI|nr:hypothetical protein QBZ16_002556 [Prototheca wickerhamii]
MRLFLAVVLLALATASCCQGAELSLDISGQKVYDQLIELAKFSDDANPAVTRILFTDQDLNARAFVKQLMRDAGLVIREDTIGNIYGILEGQDAQAPAVGTGSHCDAIPLAGAFDGTLGVIGGIAALKALKEAGFVPKVPIEAIMFTSEEPTRFGLSCSGSRAIAGMLDGDYLSTLRDVNGSDYLAAAQRAGYGADTYEAMLRGARLTDKDLGAFVELHIEQGPLLGEGRAGDWRGDGHRGPAALAVTFYGDGGHAGALLMPYRNDASLAASEFALELERLVLATESIDTVGTVGRWEVSPNAVNSVPREAALEIDIRDIDADRRDRLVADVLEAAKKVAERRKVRVTSRIINQDPPAISGKAVVDAISASVEELSYSSKHMVSRAYHDSTFMAQVAPTAMVFVPCHNGWSHRPDEHATPEDIERGVRVLALTLARLAGAASGEHSEL